MNKELIEQIIASTISELSRSGQIAVGREGTQEPSPGRSSSSGAPAKEGWLFDSVDDAVAAAKHSQAMLADAGHAHREKLVVALRRAARDNAQALARLAHEETGYGHIAHKETKNLLAADKTPGVEDLQPVGYTGDNGLTLVEQAPFGVIGSIIPSTNPTATVINNSISMVAAGNAVVFNPHPAARRCSQEAVRVLQQAVAEAGGPPALLVTIAEPTMESGRQIMSHPDIPLLAVTGGEAVVKAAMGSGKRVVAAGPGNPPVVVDETAVLDKAAKDIVDGASFENNILCVAEKEVFAVEAIADDLIRLMQQNGAHLLAGGDIDRVMAAVLLRQETGYAPNRKFVGKNADVILREAGVSFAGSPRLIIVEVDAGHPFITTEMLMPVLGIARVRDVQEGIRCALRAEAGNHHSAMIHSTNVHNMSAMARAMDTTIFVKNAPSYAGLGFNGEGFATLTIATPTGEGLTSARSFTRQRRCVLYGDFSIV